MKKIHFVALISISLWTGCSKDNTTANYTPTCTGAAKSYKNDVAPLIESACAHCHTNYSSYANLFSAKIQYAA